MTNLKSEVWPRFGGLLRTCLLAVALLAPALQSLAASDPFTTLAPTSPYSILNLVQPPQILAGNPALQTAISAALQTAADANLMGANQQNATLFGGYTHALSNPFFNQAITGNATISLSGGTGKYVLRLASIDLQNGAILAINAPAGSKVVLNILGSFVVNNGQIVVGGGLKSKDLLFNLTTANQSGNNRNTIARVTNGNVSGTILARGMNVEILGNSKIKGQVIARTVTLGAGAVVSPEF